MLTLLLHSCRAGVTLALPAAVVSLATVIVMLLLNRALPLETGQIRAIRVPLVLFLLLTTSSAFDSELRSQLLNFPRIHG